MENACANNKPSIEMMGLIPAPRLAQPVRPPLGIKKVLLPCRLHNLQLKLKYLTALGFVVSHLTLH